MSGLVEDHAAVRTSFTGNSVQGNSGIFRTGSRAGLCESRAMTAALAQKDLNFHYGLVRRELPVLWWGLMVLGLFDGSERRKGCHSLLWRLFLLFIFVCQLGAFVRVSTEELGDVVPEVAWIFYPACFLAARWFFGHGEFFVRMSILIQDLQRPMPRGYCTSSYSMDENRSIQNLVKLRCNIKKVMGLALSVAMAFSVVALSTDEYRSEVGLSSYACLGLGIFGNLTLALRLAMVQMVALAFYLVCVSHKCRFQRFLGCTFGGVELATSGLRAVVTNDSALSELLQCHLHLAFDLNHSSRAVRPILAVLVFPVLVCILTVVVTLAKPHAFEDLKKWMIHTPDFFLTLVLTFAILCMSCTVSQDFERLNACLRDQLWDISPAPSPDRLMALAAHLDRRAGMDLFGYCLDETGLTRLLYVTMAAGATLMGSLRKNKA